MSNKLYEENDVQAIANAIRSKNGSSDTYMVSEMAQAVLDIPTGTTPTGTKQVTIDSAGATTEDVTNYANAEITVPQGQYKPNIDARPTAPTITVSNGGLITAEVPTEFITDLLKPSFTEGYIESSDVSMTVKIGGSATKQMNTVNGQTVTPTTSQQNIAVQGDFVLGAINVAPIPSQYIIPTGTKQITANGTGIDVSEYEFVDVSVSASGYTDNQVASRNYNGAIVLNGIQTKNYAFQGATGITSVYERNSSSTNNGVQYLFSGCTSLTSVDMTLQSSAANWQYTFDGCTNLTSVNLPNCVAAHNYCFRNCQKLETLTLPKLNTTNDSGFRSCYLLKTVDLGATATTRLNRISPNDFNNCRMLTALILRYTQSVVPLNNVSAFTNTPFTGYGGTYSGHVYVPSALLNSYKTATNWSTLYGDYSDLFLAIEGSQYE